MVALAGCATAPVAYDHRAAALGFERIALQGAPFVHVAYVPPRLAASGTLHVYIEHDGLPWLGEIHVATDPTPRTPFALELMARDSAARLLLGRPCYFGVVDRNCHALLWTHERYSPHVVASMAQALRAFLEQTPFERVILIGYSGGGTLAWLLAPAVPETVAVLTIAANLDVQAWAAAHQYTALAGSLDPATAAPLPSRIAQVHWTGERDRVVPPTTIAGFARAHPAARVLRIAEFDHVCCWIERWPQLLARFEALAAAVTPPRDISSGGPTRDAPTP